MVQYLDNNNGFNQWNSMRASQQKKSKSFGFFGWLIMFLFAWWIMGVWFKPQDTVVATQDVINVEKSTAAVSTIDGDKISADVQGLRISKISLKDYKVAPKNPENVSLLKADDNFVEVGFVSTDTQTPNINTHWEKKSGLMHWNSASNIHFVRDVKIDGYVIKISDTVKNNSKKDINVVPYARIVQSQGETGSAAVETGGIVYANSDLNYANWQKLNKKSFAYSTVRGSFGFAEQYWETVAAIDSNDQTISLKKSGDLYFANNNAAPVKVLAGNSVTVDSYVFAGPRIASILDAASENIPGINKTMDYGWFWFFSEPVLWMLNGLFDFVGNYGLAIILMTLILRLLMWPLTRKSFISTMAMQKMQPELQRVQKLYANDKARLQIEMMKIYQTHKTSPMSGCLPMLLQIPIFFALYKALLISVPMRNAEFLWIHDLAAMDPYLILPILMGASMWLQQYLQTPHTTNMDGPAASTQRVMKWMPVLFTVMFLWMPAGLVLYWTVSNLFGIFQMYVIKKTTK